MDPIHDLQERIDEATRRLLGTVEGFSDDDVRQPSLLPGWTRGHVLTHLARGAEALGNLVEWARDGVPRQAYASQEARNADIEAGAGRGAADLLADIRATAGAFGSAAASVPAEGWQRKVSALNYPEFPATELLVRRLVEVELHHVDLGAGFGPDDWPAEFAAMELAEPMRTQRADRAIR